MATTTTNFNLIKPSFTDGADITATNPNWDTIDAQLKLAASTMATENTTVYVSTTGNDTSGDGTSGSPYKTIMKAINSIPKNLNGKTATIQIGGGTYSESVVIRGFTDTITLNFTDITTISQLTIYCSSVLFMGSKLFVNGAILVSNGGIFTVANIIEITNGSTGITANNGSCCNFRSTIIFSGSITNGVLATGTSRIAFYDVTGAVSGTAFLVSFGGVISYNSATVTATALHNSGSGGRIYSASQLSIPRY